MKAMGSMLLCLVPGVVLAAPLQFSQQGRLLDGLGAPVQGTHELTVTLYEVPGGSVVWSKAIPGVTFADGYYAVTLSGTGSGGNTLEEAFAADPGTLEMGFVLDQTALSGRQALHHTPTAGYAERSGAAALIDAEASCNTVGGIGFDVSTSSQYVCVDSAWTRVAASRPLLHVQERDAANTSVGTSGGGMTRNLDSVRTNEIPGAFLANSFVTLPAGTYYAEFHASGFGINQHQVSLVDASNTLLVLGSSEKSEAGAGESQTRSMGAGRFTLTESTSVRLRHYLRDARTNGAGHPGEDDSEEIFADLRIWQVD